MKRALRLRRSADIQRVLREGKSWANQWLVLYVLPGAEEYPRCAFITGKRTGKAVMRNLLKRRLREAVRRRLPEVKGGWDLVFIARRKSADADFAQCVAAVDQLLFRAGLVSPPSGRDRS